MKLPCKAHTTGGTLIEVEREIWYRGKKTLWGYAVMVIGSGTLTHVSEKDVVFDVDTNEEGD